MLKEKGMFFQYNTNLGSLINMETCFSVSFNEGNQSIQNLIKNTVKSIVFLKK